MRTQQSRTRHLARWILASFLVTFLMARMLVFCIMSQRIPDLYLFIGGTHVHHLNYGIFLLSGVGAWLLLMLPRGERRTIAAILYGVGLGLTFDEFGMWLHLGGGYWQRVSFDAVAVIAGGLGLIVVAPAWRHMRQVHFLVAIGLLALIGMFTCLLVESLSRAEQKWRPALQRLELEGPR